MVLLLGLDVRVIFALRVTLVLVEAVVVALEFVILETRAVLNFPLALVVMAAVMAVLGANELLHLPHQV